MVPTTDLALVTRGLREIAQQPPKSYFRLSGLEPALDRRLLLLIGLGLTHALAEEIGIAAEVLDRCQRDRIDPLLHQDLPRSRERGDAMRERSDKRAERVSG